MVTVDSRLQMYTSDPEKDGGGISNNAKTWDILIDVIDDVPYEAHLLAHCVCDFLHGCRW